MVAGYKYYIPDSFLANNAQLYNIGVFWIFNVNLFDLFIDFCWECDFCVLNLEPLGTSEYQFAGLMIEPNSIWEKMIYFF